MMGAIITQKKSAQNDIVFGKVLNRALADFQNLALEIESKTKSGHYLVKTVYISVLTHTWIVLVI